jgi:signal transduction histidine kinase
MRGWPGTGLRARLLLALLVTSAVTLLTASLALLSPLQNRLRDQSVGNLQAALLSARPQFEVALAKAQRARGGDSETAALLAILPLANKLHQRTGARVLVADVIPRPVYDTDNDARFPELEILRVLREDSYPYRHLTDDEATVAARIFIHRQPEYLLVAKKPLTDVTAAVDQVRNAFLAAALAGLAAALVLGTALATTLTRRIGRLRSAVRRITQEGPNAPEPRDTTRDEIGDLARAFAAMQEALRRQEGARRAFVATASHELRTPLTSLQWTLEMLEEDLHEGRLDVDDAQRQVAFARGELRRLGRLASELLDLSRLDADVELRCEPVELGETARAVAAEFEVRAHEHDVALEVMPPLGPCWARGDPGAIARIARILLDNALRFAPPGDAVRVVAAYHGDHATLEVSDHGPGVPPDERELIFERFQRGTATGGEGGVGLGLAIGRELAERQGGTLELAPGDGPGARFVLRLPIEMPAGSAPPEPDAVATS